MTLHESMSDGRLQKQKTVEGYSRFQFLQKSNHVKWAKPQVFLNKIKSSVTLAALRLHLGTMDLYKKGQYDSSPKVRKEKHLSRHLVAACSTRHKPCRR